MLYIAFKYLALMLAVTLVSPLSHAEYTCEDIFAIEVPSRPKPVIDPLLNMNLLRLQKQETMGRSRTEIEAMNAESIRALLASDSTPTSTRVKEVSPSVVKHLIASMTKNPIVSASNRGLYDQEDVKIGYCFGRAAYAHLVLLKMGVDKDSILKAWAVGRMGDGAESSWQFHVATVVRGLGGKWYAVDDELEGKVVDVQEWFKTYAAENPQGDLRIYFTDPKKFSAELGTYDSLNLGLDLPRDQDWYKGFFKDLMVWFQKGSLDSIGLQKLTH